jgi:hypothetical protein
VALTEERLDVTGNMRLRQKVNRVAVEGIRNKFEKGLGIGPTDDNNDEEIEE